MVVLGDKKYKEKKVVQLIVKIRGVLKRTKQDVLDSYEPRITIF